MGVSSVIQVSTHVASCMIINDDKIKDKDMDDYEYELLNMSQEEMERIANAADEE